MENLTEVENMTVGGAAAFVEAVILQPTIYWKNAAQQGLPFTLNPKLVYRGLGAALCNEMGQMASQFGTTGFVKRLLVGDSDANLSGTENIVCAMAGGVLASPIAQLAEVTMIQQQLHGGTLVGTPIRVFSTYSISGLCRGWIGAASRDCIYVGGLLGVTPVLQNTLAHKYNLNHAIAGVYASVFAGFAAGFLTTPFDAISTVMKGDQDKKIYGGFVDTLRKRAGRGLRVLFGGALWRSINIIGTIGIANECSQRFAPLMYPARF